MPMKKLINVEYTQSKRFNFPFYRAVFIKYDGETLIIHTITSINTDDNN